jgi:hypothetical protein
MTDPRACWPFFEAILTLRDPDAGGRRLPIRSGFRASWLVPDRSGGRTYHDGPIFTPDARAIAPGKEAIVHIFPVAPEFWTAVGVGTQLEMKEGPMTLGVAQVIGQGTKDLSH